MVCIFKPSKAKLDAHEFFTGNFTYNFVPANITLQVVTGAAEEDTGKREKINEFCKTSHRTLSVHLVGIF